MEDKNNLSRRSTLKTIAGSAAGLTAFSGAVSANRSNSTPSPVVVLGDEDNPLTRGDITSAVKRYKNEYRQATGEKSPKGFPAPDFDDSDQYVSGYVYYIGSDGLPMTHVSYGYPVEEPSGDVSTDSTTTTTSAVPGHERAKQQAKQFESSGSAGTYSISPDASGDVSTAADQDVTSGEGWSSHGVVTGSGEASNWGEVTIQGELFHLAEDYEAYDSKDAWAMVGTYQANNNACSSCWGDRTIKDAEVNQAWSSSTIEVKEPEISNYVPSTSDYGRITGTTVELGASASSSGGTAGGAVSWTYRQPKMDTNVLVDAAGHNNDAFWRFKYNEDNHTNFLVNPGSVCWLDDQVDNIWDGYAPAGGTDFTTKFWDDWDGSTKEVNASIIWSAEY